jgi:hypothetical protein
VLLDDRGEDRQSIPTEMDLRLMFLKYRYELFCALVMDSITSLQFCRAPTLER